MFSHNFTFVEWVILFALSLILPLSIFSGRGNIRKRRLAVLSDLEEKVFKRGKDKYDGALPFIEVVRARYKHAACQEGRTNTKAMVINYVFEIFTFLLSTTMFVILSMTGF